MKNNHSVEAMAGEEGYTLLETLVSMSIIGVLSSLSVIMFSRYEVDAYNSQAQTHLHQLIVSEEAFYSTADEYISCSTSDCNSILRGVAPAPGVLVDVRGTPEAFSVSTCSRKGTILYSWDSITSITVTDSIEQGSCSPEAPEV